MPTIDERLMLLLIQFSGSKREDIHADSGLRDIGLDSMDRVELVMAVEDEFGIELTDCDIANLETVQDLLDLVNKAAGG